MAAKVIRKRAFLAVLYHSRFKSLGFVSEAMLSLKQKKMS